MTIAREAAAAEGSIVVTIIMIDQIVWFDGNGINGDFRKIEELEMMQLSEVDEISDLP